MTDLDALVAIGKVCKDCGASLPLHYPTCRSETAEEQRRNQTYRLGAAIITPHFATRRQDLADLRDRILALLYERSGTISVAEAIGILEIAKMELFEEQK